MATVKYYYKHNETTQIYYFIILPFRSLTIRLTSRFSKRCFSLWISLGEFTPLLIWIAGRYLCLAAVGLRSYFLDACPISLTHNCLLTYFLSFKAAIMDQVPALSECLIAWWGWDEWSHREGREAQRGRIYI